MKKTLTLLDYYWKSGSWSLWSMAILAPLSTLVLFGMPLFFEPLGRVDTSWPVMKSLYLGGTFPLIAFPIILGLRFFVQASTSNTSRPTPFADAEFLLSRPIARRQAHQASILLYYSLILLMLLPILGLALRHPTHEVFVLSAIPCLLFLLSGIVTQGIAHIPWSPKILRYLLTAILILPAWWNLYRIRSIKDHETISLDDLLSFFVHHAFATLLAVAALFTFVQWVAERRAERADVS